jgi:hypothetical protein
MRIDEKRAMRAVLARVVFLVSTPRSMGSGDPFTLAAVAVLLLPRLNLEAIPP